MSRRACLLTGRAASEASLPDDSLYLASDSSASIGALNAGSKGAARLNIPEAPVPEHPVSESAAKSITAASSLVGRALSASLKIAVSDCGMPENF